MRVLLNETPFYDVALEAVDGVDKILASKPRIEGLEVASDPRGFTFVDDEGNSTSGLRSQLLGKDSGFSYSFGYIPGVEQQLYRADFSRAGFLLYLTYQTHPLDNNPAFTVTADLASQISNQS